LQGKRSGSRLHMRIRYPDSLSGDNQNFALAFSFASTSAIRATTARPISR
jgi:hypothetical protein